MEIQRCRRDIESKQSVRGQRIIRLPIQGLLSADNALNKDDRGPYMPSRLAQLWAQATRIASKTPLPSSLLNHASCPPLSKNAQCRKHFFFDKRPSFYSRKWPHMSRAIHFSMDPCAERLMTNTVGSLGLNDSGIFCAALSHILILSRNEFESRRLDLSTLQMLYLTRRYMHGWDEAARLLTGDMCFLCDIRAPTLLPRTPQHPSN